MIIFDNVEEREAIEPYLLVVDAEPHLLLTSRAPQKGFVSIDISLLDEELSLQLLFKESDRDFDSLPVPEQEAAQEITRSLGGLPLAIEIVGAYLSYIKSCTFQEYRAFLEENLQEAMKGELLSSFTKHEENLFLTLQISKTVLDKAPLLNDILDLLAWSGTSFMGISLMAAILDKKEPELYKPLQLGVSLHLLQKAEDEKRYDIHRLVRRVRQEQSPIINRVQWIKDICQRLGDWFEERSVEFNNLPAFEAEIDHLREWLRHIKPLSSYHAGRLTWLQFFPPSHLGKYHESHQLVQSAFSLLADTSEDDPKLKANILNDLGFTYNSMGQFQKALEYYNQALVIREETFGVQHQDTARSIANVGGTYGNLGDHKKALEYQLRALEILKKLFGEQHPHTASSFNNVGITYGDLGDYDKALEYQLRALGIDKQLFGEQHPDTANSLHNIGYTYSNMGNHNEALKYLERAFEIRPQLLGDHHPKTVNTFSYLIYSLTKLKKFPEARERLNDYLDQLSLDHPKYEKLSSLKKFIQKEERKSMHSVPSKKKKKKKKYG